jgi:hypothetical protein
MGDDPKETFDPTKERRALFMKSFKSINLAPPTLKFIKLIIER